MRSTFMIVAIVVMSGFALVFSAHAGPFSKNKEGTATKSATQGAAPKTTKTTTAAKTGNTGSSGSFTGEWCTNYGWLKIMSGDDPCGVYTYDNGKLHNCKRDDTSLEGRYTENAGAETGKFSFFLSGSSAFSGKYTSNAGESRRWCGDRMTGDECPEHITCK